ncbi:MAG: sugar transferase [Oscillospiraceae bacterium]|nr:sugar transferase [Candidatus Ruminococcus equi]
MLLPFEKLPIEFQNDSVKKYYDILDKKRKSIFVKRAVDLVLSIIMLILLLIPMLVIAVCVKASSKGPVFYRQERVTTYNKKFMILKFRSMRVDSDKGSLITTENDDRVTSVGHFIRKYRLDELPQVFHVISGKMSFVGTRPEVAKYVAKYSDEMMATLLLPAGVTSLASIMFKDEEKIVGEITNINDVDRVYVEEILPKKMEYNLEYLSEFGLRKDAGLMFKTVKDVLF